MKTNQKKQKTERKSDAAKQFLSLLSTIYKQSNLSSYLADNEGIDSTLKKYKAELEGPEVDFDKEIKKRTGELKWGALDYGLGTKTEISKLGPIVDDLSELLDNIKEDETKVTLKNAIDFLRLPIKYGLAL
jgi:hypothetical protein